MPARSLYRWEWLSSLPTISTGAAFRVGLLRETVYGTLDGRPYRKGKGALNPSLLLLDNKTLILAPDQTLARMLATRETMPTDESISQQLSQGIGKALDIHVVANTVSLRALVGLQLEQLEPQTETWQALAQLLDGVERFEIRARLSQQFAVGAVMDATSNDAALRMQSWWESWSQSVAGTGQDAVSDALPIAGVFPAMNPLCCRTMRHVIVPGSSNATSSVLCSSTWRGSRFE